MRWWGALTPGATGVLIQEGCDVPDLGVDDDPAIIF